MVCVQKTEVFDGDLVSVTSVQPAFIKLYHILRSIYPSDLDQKNLQHQVAVGHFKLLY